MKKWILATVFMMTLSGLAVAQKSPAKAVTKTAEHKTIRKGIDNNTTSVTKPQSLKDSIPLIKLELPGIGADTLNVPKVKNEE